VECMNRRRKVFDSVYISIFKENELALRVIAFGVDMDFWWLVTKIDRLSQLFNSHVVSLCHRPAQAYPLSLPLINGPKFILFTIK
jgi:hypothetical protein